MEILLNATKIPTTLTKFVCFDVLVMLFSQYTCIYWAKYRTTTKQTKKEERKKEGKGFYEISLAFVATSYAILVTYFPDGDDVEHKFKDTILFRGRGCLKHLASNSKTRLNVDHQAKCTKPWLSLSNQEPRLTTNTESFSNGRLCTVEFSMTYDLIYREDNYTRGHVGRQKGWRGLIQSAYGY